MVGKRILTVAIILGWMIGAGWTTNQKAIGEAASAMQNGAALASQQTETQETALPPLLREIAWRPRSGGGVNALCRVQNVSGEAWLFLPSCANLTQLVFENGSEFSEWTVQGLDGEKQTIRVGEPFDLTALMEEPEDGIYRLKCSVKEDPSATLKIMRSAHQAALWLVSDDPVNQGRQWLEEADVLDKTATTGEMLLLDENGTLLYSDELRELRGRGNTTWSQRKKKPYQIKLAQKTNLLSNGEENRARTWVLLAEAFDPSLLHNTLTLALGRELGLAGTPECRPVDLYYDGEYRGFYLLCEKAHVNPGRLDLFDYSAYLEEGNPNIENRETYPLSEGENEYGVPYQYVDGITSDLETQGAYLIELDRYSYRSEDSYFVAYDASTGLEEPFVFKTPEYAPQRDAEYISRWVQELLDAAVNGGENPITGDGVFDKLELRSFARLMLVNQLAKTVDLGNTSTFFYLPQGEEKLYAGPLWDFDIAYGIRDGEGEQSGAAGYVPQAGWLRETLKLPQLQQEMKTVWTEELAPLVRRIVLDGGEQTALGLRSLEDYQRSLDATARMNNVLWAGELVETDHTYPTFEENLQALREYLTQRADWLDEDLSYWNDGEIDKVKLALTLDPSDPEGTVQAMADSGFPNYEVLDCLLEEQEEGTLRVTIELMANEDCAFLPQLTAKVNGSPAEVELTSSEECSVTWVWGQDEESNAD